MHKGAFLPLLLLLLVMSVLTSSSTVAQSPTLYENYNVTADMYTTAYDVNWRAQTFTVGSVGHTVTIVKIRAYSVGSPAILDLSIRATDENGRPTGGDLTSGYIDADEFTTNALGEWYGINVTEYSLDPNTKYAIVIRATEGSESDTVNWLGDYTSPAYENGNLENSADSGSSWTPQTEYDMLFEVWGFELSPEWYSVENWTNYVHVPEWHNVENWTNYVNVLTWYEIGVWTNYIGAVDDNAPPVINIDYAGRNGDNWVNNVHMMDNYMEIKVIVTDNSNLENVILEWYDNGSWENYEMDNIGGNYYLENMVGLENERDYSFNVWAIDVWGNDNKIEWLRLDNTQHFTRRYVRANYAPTDNLDYKQFYLTHAYVENEGQPGSAYGSILEHEQYGGNPTSLDWSYLDDDYPPDDVYGYCSDWVFTNMNENLTLDNVLIDNIFYYFWWNVNDEEDVGTLYYEKEKVGKGVSWEDSYWELDSTVIILSENKKEYPIIGYFHDRYMLHSGFWDVQDNYWNSDDIYRMKLELYRGTGYDIEWLGIEGIASFFIFNIPDNTTLQGMDSDNDGLTDYEELYENYTNPFQADTDADGINDNEDLDPLINPASLAPTLYLPENNAKTGMTPYFEWVKSGGVDNHRLLIDNDSDFSSPRENRTFPTASSYTIPQENLLDVDNYYWKVTAEWNGDSSESETWTFEIRWLTVGIWTNSITVGPRTPAKPVLYLPADGSTVTPPEATPYFEWTVGEGADNHRLLVDNDSDFSSPEENRVLIDNFYTISNDNALPDDNYSWKVGAINENEENWADAWTFIIANWVTPLIIEYVSGEDTGDENIYTIDNNISTFWRYGVVTTHEIWFKMAQSYSIQKIRLYQANHTVFWGGVGSGSGLIVYISDNTQDWGDIVWEGVLGSPQAWNETSEFAASGQYVRLVSKSEVITQRMYEFDAYVFEIGWHEVETWTNCLNVLTWYEVETWFNYPIASTWYEVGTWTTYVNSTTVNWYEVGTWTTYVNSVAGNWYEVGIWYNFPDAIVFEWREAQTWINNIRSRYPAWYEREGWITQLKSSYWAEYDVDPLMDLEDLVNLIIVPLIIIFAPALILMAEHGFGGFVMGMGLGTVIAAFTLNLALGFTLLIMASVIVLYWRGKGGGEEE